MSIEDAQIESRKLTFPIHLDPVERFRGMMGWINSLFMEDHIYMATSAFMFLLDEFNLWLIRDVSKLKLQANPISKFQIPNELNRILVKQLKQIWLDGMWIYQVLDRHGTIIDECVYYEEPKITNPEMENVIKLLPMKHMNPRSKTKDDTDPRVLLQGVVPVSQSWFGYDPEQLAEIVGFKFNYVDGSRQMFNTDDDVMNAEAEVIEVSREYFHSAIAYHIRELMPRKHFVWQDMLNSLSTYRYVLGMRGLEGQADESEIVTG